MSVSFGDWISRLFKAFIAAVLAPDKDPVVQPKDDDGATKPVDEPVKPPAPPVTEPVMPDSQTFVWKPISDNEHLLAIVTPARFNFNKVTVNFGAKNQKSENGRYTGRGNGNRQHWRYKMVGAKYGKKIKVVCSGVTDNKTWVIQDGSQRVEGH